MLYDFHIILKRVVEKSREGITHCNPSQTPRGRGNRQNQTSANQTNVRQTLRLALSYTSITKTCPYNIDPLKPHFYIVKLEFTGVYIIFLISAQNIDCGYSLEPPRWGGSNEYHNLCFEQKYENYRSFVSENFQFLEVKFSIYLNRRVYVMRGSRSAKTDWQTHEQNNTR